MTPEEELSNAQLEYHWHPGCDGAHRLLKQFITGGGLERFSTDRAKTDRESTSKLSPHIHFGEMSVRTVHAHATAAAATWHDESDGNNNNNQSIDDFLRQLGYREYSRYLSFHFPFTHERSLLEHLRAVPWRFDQALFKAWRTGTTGYPLVDAGMRQVWSTGWMHNRIRVVAASFMVKILLLPWQWGLKHYWDALLDADLECDALGWQYCAGCLADAHPLEYVMDLEAEAKRFDPGGNYIRRWLPVLARLPAKYIHSPWEAPPEVLEDAGVELGVNYPWPVVDMEDSKSALDVVVKIVEEAKDTINTTSGATTTSNGVVHIHNKDSNNNAQTDGNGGGGGSSAQGNNTNAMGVTGGSAGPFRPPTRPDPTGATAARVWGGGGVGAGFSPQKHQQQRNDGSTYVTTSPSVYGRRPVGRGAMAARTALSMKSTGDSVGEEVVSNAMGGGGGGGATRTTVTQATVAASGMESAAVGQPHAQHGQGMGASTVTPGDGGGVGGRPPLPPQQQLQRQEVPAAAEPMPMAVSTPECNGGGASGGSGGSGSGSGSGSGRPSATVVLATAVTVVGGVPDDDDEIMHEEDEDGGGEPIVHEGLRRRHRTVEEGEGVALPSALYGRAEGSAEGGGGGEGEKMEGDERDEDDAPIWPPERKRLRADHDDGDAEEKGEEGGHLDA